MSGNVTWCLVNVLQGKDEPTASSLHIRTKELKKYLIFDTSQEKWLKQCFWRFVTPSPGAYNPQSADKETRKSEPMFSFGIKPETKKGPHCPGESLNQWNFCCNFKLCVVYYVEIMYCTSFRTKCIHSKCCKRDTPVQVWIIICVKPACHIVLISNKKYVVELIGCCKYKIY